MLKRAACLDLGRISMIFFTTLDVSAETCTMDAPSSGLQLPAAWQQFSTPRTPLGKLLYTFILHDDLG